MARKRTPSPEQQKADRTIADSVATVVQVLLMRYPNDVGLTLASRGLEEFVESRVDPPKPRTRKAKSTPPVEYVFTAPAGPQPKADEQTPSR